MSPSSSDGLDVVKQACVLSIAVGAMVFFVLASKITPSYGIDVVVSASAASIALTFAVAWFYILLGIVGSTIT